MSRVLHVIKDINCGGGMESVIRRHIQAGESVFSFVDNISKVGNSSRYSNLSLGRLRRDFDRFLAEETGAFDCTIFYNGYGIEWVANDDRLGLKILYLHTDYPLLEKWMLRALRFVDGVVSVNPALNHKLKTLFPFIPSKRMHVVSLPIDVPMEVWERRGVPRETITIGYAGRIQLRQKRLDRLVRLAENLESSGMIYRFEFLGDGPDLQAIQARFSGLKNWHFHGHQNGDNYWRILRSWKYQLFLSDYEGLPIALLEGLAAGVIPLYPELVEGKDYVQEINPQLVYPFGEVDAIIPLLQRLEGWGDTAFDGFLRNSEQLLRGHLENKYEMFWESFMSNLADHPRRRQISECSYPLWLPVWCYHRVIHKLQFGRFRPPKFRLPD